MSSNEMAEHIRMLVIGSSPETLAYARSLPADRVEVEGLGSLFQAYWSGGAPPDAVCTPLLAPTFDILDVVERLVKFGFQGRLIAVTPPLPDARAVRREISAECRGFGLELVVVPPEG